jgi:hypothetical protein
LEPSQESARGHSGSMIGTQAGYPPGVPSHQSAITSGGSERAITAATAQESAANREGP